MNGIYLRKTHIHLHTYICNAIVFVVIFFKKNISQKYSIYILNRLMIIISSSFDRFENCVNYYFSPFEQIYKEMWIKLALTLCLIGYTVDQ